MSKLARAGVLTVPEPVSPTGQTPELPVTPAEPEPVKSEAALESSAIPERPVLEAEIREKAFHRSESRARQGQGPDPIEDWLDAEREVTGRYESPLHDLAPPRWDDSPRRNWRK